MSYDKEKVQPADASPGRRSLKKRKKAITPSSVSATSVKAEDVAELARAVCRVALLVESSQDFISISHILWVITRGSATAAEHRSAGVRGGFCRERVDEFSLWSLLPSNDYISWIYRTYMYRYR